MSQRRNQIGAGAINRHLLESRNIKSINTNMQRTSNTSLPSADGLYPASETSDPSPCLHRPRPHRPQDSRMSGNAPLPAAHPQLTLIECFVSNKRRKCKPSHRRRSLNSSGVDDTHSETTNEIVDDGRRPTKTIKPSSGRRRMSLPAKMRFPLLTIDELSELDISPPHLVASGQKESVVPVTGSVSAGSVQSTRKPGFLPPTSICPSEFPALESVVFFSDQLRAVVTPTPTKRMVDLALLTETPTLSLFQSPVRPVRRCSNDKILSTASNEGNSNPETFLEGGGVAPLLD
jgi:hypothetical protein